MQDTLKAFGYLPKAFFDQLTDRPIDLHNQLVYQSISQKLRELIIQDKLMQIYVDADACPKVIKEIIFKACERTKTKAILVADQFMRIPPSDYLRMVAVPPGIDSADDKIIELAEEGDLVITADIPLADSVISKGAQALNPRGELYTESNIKSRLAVRDMMAEMRSTGLDFGGPPPFNQKDKQNFANQLDRFLAKHK